jgi:hypothetical protein
MEISDIGKNEKPRKDGSVAAETSGRVQCQRPGCSTVMVS